MQARGGLLSVKRRKVGHADRTGIRRQGKLVPMSLDLFHPAVRGWFEQQLGQPTGVQQQAWPAIRSGAHSLLAAPTGSGKTLAAFLAVIDALLREGLDRGLEPRTRVLYISPLKALSNDIQRNLQAPLQGVRDELLMHGLPDVEIRAWVRTGDTPASERSRAVREPPHILVTTPESAYILLTSESGRRMLGAVETVIVDEIHALAGSKRGSHLTLSLERLEALTSAPRLQRIGLSATQKPIEEMAHFLVGARDEDCVIVDTGHVRARDLALWTPGSPLEAVMSNEVWQEVYDQLQSLVESHRSTLIFVNTRRLAERAARFLAERLGEANVMAHHGSLSREQRLAAEQRLKQGDLPCLVATASLELGIDIGDIDLVCQLGSPRSIAAFLQRVGRSGHAVGATPKGRLFPLTRDDLVECTALLDAAQRSELDHIIMPRQPLDVLAQQIVAEVGGREWEVEALYRQFRHAWPYRALAREQFDAVVQMLAQGFSTRRGRRAAHIHYDAVNQRLRPRRGARLTALTNGGAIPDLFDCDVILQPEGLKVGTLNEDFAFESLPGDIFQLGNTSYRILKTETGKVLVEDAHGQPPNIPFWFGEAPGRTDELSQAVSRLRNEVERRLPDGMDAVTRALCERLSLPRNAAEQLTAYLAASRAALGVLPSHRQIVLERFFDEVGDMHLVIHSPYGSRINKAWGLALRKRFCRKFNFELQAAALDDTIVLSLSATHSFPLEEVAGYLHSASVRHPLIQALLDAPMFAARWRWNATIALAVRRFLNGKRAPPYFQRSDAEDLVAVVFPDQIACFENIAGEREVPDHPLVEQTIGDCLHETMDIDGLETLLRDIESGRVRVHCADLAGPSPMAQEVLNARPYAFLDDAPAEERRTMAVQSRSRLDPVEAAELARLDGAAIDKVRAEAWPDARTADELHDALVLLGFMTVAEAERQGGPGLAFGWQHLFDTLADQQRATVLTPPAGEPLWVAAERLAEHQCVHPGAVLSPRIAPVALNGAVTDREAAVRELLRSRLEGLGPVTADTLAAPLGLSSADAGQALLALEQEGFVVRGQFTSPTVAEEWCERRLLARIHRYTLKRLRSEIEPVSPAIFMRFLFEWQGVMPVTQQGDERFHADAAERREGSEALAATLAQLEGCAIAAIAWESDVLPVRIHGYRKDQLDALCLAGQLVWTRLQVGQSGERKRSSVVRQAPIALLSRAHLPIWRRLAATPSAAKRPLGSDAARVRDALAEQGAAFFVDLVQTTGLLRTQVENALGELVNHALVTSDSFAGLRALITPSAKRARFGGRRGRQTLISPFDSAGRWSLLPEETDEVQAEDVEFLAQVLLRRYGVVFRQLLARETVTLPWRELLRVFWRMEARGEIRGGRFVQGFSGEQFALPEAVGRLRAVRRLPARDGVIRLSAVDPLYLQGIVTPGERVAAGVGRVVEFRQGDFCPKPQPSPGGRGR